jgi:hypothetical protein
MNGSGSSAVGPKTAVDTRDPLPEYCFQLASPTSQFGATFAAPRSMARVRAAALGAVSGLRDFMTFDELGEVISHDWGAQ